LTFQEILSVMNGKNGVGVTKPDTDRKWREVGIKM
jgi:hypothetical protein